MFVDEKKAGEAQTKSDPFSLDSLIAWLEKQPAEKEYDWYDIDGCLVCIYLREVTGVKKPASYGPWPNGTSGFGHDTFGPDWGYSEICATAPWTFGAALERARAIRSTTGTPR